MSNLNRGGVIVQNDAPQSLRAVCDELAALVSERWEGARSIHFVPCGIPETTDIHFLATDADGEGYGDYMPCVSEKQLRKLLKNYRASTAQPEYLQEYCLRAWH